MAKNQIETIKESTLITDDEGLARFTEILNHQEEFKIKHQNSTFKLKAGSVIKIFRMANQLLEEHSLFAYRCRINQINYQDEDSYYYENVSKKKSNTVIDTEDVIISRKEKNDSENNSVNTVPNSMDNEVGVTDGSRKKYLFEKHFYFFHLIWEICYYIMILSAMVFFCHLGFIVFNANSLLSVYMILGTIIDILLFICGIYGLILIEIEKEQDINERNINFFLYILLGFTLGTFIYGEYILEGDLAKYLINHSFFLYMFIWLLIIETSCIILNFEMNQLYLEYKQLLPLTHPLLSARNGEFNDKQE